MMMMMMMMQMTRTVKKTLQQLNLTLLDDFPWTSLPGSYIYIEIQTYSNSLGSDGTVPFCICWYRCCNEEQADGGSHGSIFHLGSFLLALQPGTEGF